MLMSYLGIQHFYKFHVKKKIKQTTDEICTKKGLKAKKCISVMQCNLEHLVVDSTDRDILD